VQTSAVRLDPRAAGLRQTLALPTDPASEAERERLQKQMGPS